MYQIKYVYLRPKRDGQASAPHGPGGVASTYEEYFRKAGFGAVEAQRRAGELLSKASS